MTITVTRWGWTHPVCVCVCWCAEATFLRQPVRKCRRLQRGQKGCRLESSEVPGGGDQRRCRGPFLSPRPGVRLRGHVDPCPRKCSHQSSTLTFCFCPCEWVMLLWWAEQPGVLREISSCKPLLLSYLGLDWVGKAGNRQHSNKPPPPSICPYGLFSGRTPAVSCNYRFAELLFTPRWTQRSQASLFHRQKGAKLMEPREAGGALEQQPERQEVRVRVHRETEWLLKKNCKVVTQAININALEQNAFE